MVWGDEWVNGVGRLAQLGLEGGRGQVRADVRQEREHHEDADQQLEATGALQPLRQRQCSLAGRRRLPGLALAPRHAGEGTCPGPTVPATGLRSEEHTSELQSLMRLSYAVFCLKKKNKHRIHTDTRSYHTSH